MHSYSYHFTENNTSISISLDLFEGETFRLTKETNSGFGTDEEIYNGTFVSEGDVLKLKSEVCYAYSKYLTDIEPSEIIRNQTEVLELKKEGRGYRFKEYLLQ